MVALLIAFAVIVVLLIAFWNTLHTQARAGAEPTLAEHAAADAGRSAPAAVIGPHDAATVGPPGFLDEALIRDRNGLDVR